MLRHGRFSRAVPRAQLQTALLQAVWDRSGPHPPLTASEGRSCLKGMPSGRPLAGMQGDPRKSAHREMPGAVAGGGPRQPMASNAVPFALLARSVEHDFRQQEGRFQRVLSHIEGDTTPSSPVAAAGAIPPPRQEPSPVTKLPAKLDAKKSRRKCFWFL